MGVRMFRHKIRKRDILIRECDSLGTSLGTSLRFAMLGGSLCYATLQCLRITQYGSRIYIPISNLQLQNILP